MGDAPRYPLNLLATVNALLGLVFIHTSYLAPNQNTNYERLPDGYQPGELAEQVNCALTPANCHTYGDTTDITIPTKTLPIVQPLLLLANATGTTAIVKPLVDLVSPVIRVLIDVGYDRSINPGEYTTFRLFPFINPVTLAQDLGAAVREGVQAFIDDLKGTPQAPTAVVSESENDSIAARFTETESDSPAPSADDPLGNVTASIPASSVMAKPPTTTRTKPRTRFPTATRPRMNPRATAAPPPSRPTLLRYRKALQRSGIGA